MMAHFIFNPGTGKWMVFLYVIAISGNFYMDLVQKPSCSVLLVGGTYLKMRSLSKFLCVDDLFYLGVGGFK